MVGDTCEHRHDAARKLHRRTLESGKAGAARAKRDCRWDGEERKSERYWSDVLHRTARTAAEDRAARACWGFVWTFEGVDVDGVDV